MGSKRIMNDMISLVSASSAVHVREIKIKRYYGANAKEPDWREVRAVTTSGARQRVVNIMRQRALSGLIGGYFVCAVMGTVCHKANAAFLRSHSQTDTALNRHNVPLAFIGLGLPSSDPIQPGRENQKQKISNLQTTKKSGHPLAKGLLLLYGLVTPWFCLNRSMRHPYNSDAGKGWLMIACIVPFSIVVLWGIFIGAE